MQETPEVVEQPVASSAPKGPGQELQTARQARGLSVEQVASQLRLHVHLVEALEADDYEQLPPAAYVAGYLRAYARLLGLSEQAILASFEQSGVRAPDLSVVAKGQPAQVRASDPPVKLASYVVVGALLVLLGSWWFSQREEARQDGSDGTVALTVPAVPAETIADEMPAPGGSESEPPQEHAAPVPEPVPAPVESTVETVEAATTPAPAATAAPEQAVPPHLTPDMPQSSLALEFDADCWTEIEDAAGRRLFYDLAQTGRRLTLRGEAPFKIFLGYSPGARVFLNGDFFDHSPFQRRDIARFRLGAVTDNAPRSEAE